MMILLSKLFRVPVVAIGDGKVGDLGEPVINIENGQLLAFHIKTGSFFPEKKLISLVDIIVLDSKIVIIKSPDSLIDPNEVVRVKASLETHFTLMKAKAYTLNGTYLGRIEDAVIDTDQNSITKYYIKNMLQSRIFHADSVVEIKKNKIIFENSVLDLQTTKGATA